MPTHHSHYVGRFAPSPSGPLHAGSLVAALASWLDARAHGGKWLVRIEDTDAPRCVVGAAELILQQLAACGLVADAPPLWQHTRGTAYAAALQSLLDRGLAYPCGCTRKEVDEVALAHGRLALGAPIYPGTCRDGLHGKKARAVRLLTSGAHGELLMDWCDRRLGPQQQNLTRQVGDFIVKRADGLWAYQLAVVVDDAAQGVSHVVRGADLADNTPRQIWLQRLLGLHTPMYLHHALVLGADGHKLSKQNGAAALDLRNPVAALQAAADVLELPTLPATTREDWLAQAVPAWAVRWVA